MVKKYGFFFKSLQQGLPSLLEVKGLTILEWQLI